MLQPLDRLRRANEPAGAAAHHVGDALLVDLADRGGAANRAMVGKDVRLRVRRPLFEHRPKHLRNDVARPLNAHRIADADVLAGDFILIVQRGVGDDDAADRHRIEPRDRRQRARAANLDLDVAQHGRRLLGRKFMRNGPARRARDEAEAVLQTRAN